MVKLLPFFIVGALLGAPFSVSDHAHGDPLKATASAAAKRGSPNGADTNGTNLRLALVLKPQLTLATGQVTLSSIH